jgi:regulator of nonsense transcripts 2
LHQRFPDTFTLLFTYHLAKALAPSPKLTHQQLAQAGTTPEQREKEEASRISRSRVLIRVATELWLVGMLRNVEDGVASLSTEGSTGVSSKSGSATKDAAAAAMTGTSKDSKGAPVDGKGMPNFIYTILHDLVCLDTL